MNYLRSFSHKYYYHATISSLYSFQLSAHNQIIIQVHGIIRRSSSFNTGRIDHIYRDRHETGVKLFLHYGDLCDATNLITIIANTKPDEIYILGAMSHVKVSFDMPEVSEGEFLLCTVHEKWIILYVFFILPCR